MLPLQNPNRLLPLAGLLLFLLPALLQAQCGGRRYLDPVFEAVRTQSNVNYATSPALAGLCNLEFWTFSDNLKLDVYEPLGDSLNRRPVLVYAHGGAFAIGDKRMAPVEDYCLAMAERGFVVVSLDYRKCFNALSFESPVRAVYRAVQDMRSAIRFVREFAPALGVDTNLVFAGGNSAGAFMALHAAYADEDERAASLGATYSFPDLGCLDCSGNIYARGGSPNAVINLWGALLDTAWMEPGDPPLLSVHGGTDVLVFPGYWPPFSWPLFPAVYGSTPINERADRLGIPSDYWFLPLEGHEPWLLSVNAGYYFDFIVEKSSGFLHRQQLKPRTAPISGPLPACSGQVQEYNVPATAGSRYCWSVSGGTILSSAGPGVTVRWDTPGTGSLRVTETNRIGASGDTVQLDLLISEACCPVPLAAGETVSSPNSATLQWAQVSGTSGYEIEGGPLGGGTRRLSTSSASRTINILQPGQAYRWRVRSVCSEGFSGFNDWRVFSTPLERKALGQRTEVQLYPNPSHGLVWLDGLDALRDEGPETMHNAPLRLRLFDPRGAELMRIALADAAQPLQLPAELPDGLYMLAWTAGTQSGMLPLVLSRP
jgi:hypothetical protein